MARILDAPVPELPEELAEIARLRSAARRILEEPGLTPEERTRLLAPLAPAMRRACLRDWALESVLDEMMHPSFPRESLPGSLVRRARLLRPLGYPDCPSCARPVLSQFEEEQDDRRRRGAEEARAVWNRAAPLAGRSS